MLKSLSIQNYALISQLEVDFSGGFSVLTGETGAGKSIILGALSLILGQRADAKSIKEGENRCLIEGVFDISSYKLQSFFEENELEYDATHCILRRELLISGKSRAFINDTPVGLNELKLLASQLIDIHSQHQNLMLADGNFQMQVLDVLIENKDLKKAYQDAFKQYTTCRKQLDTLKEEASRKTSEEDYLRFQYNQLVDANLKENEQSELESELEILSHLEEIKTGLFKSEQNLSGNEQSVVPMLKEVLNTITALNKVYPESIEMSSRLESSYLEIKDLTSEISKKQEHLELDPERLQFVNERLDLLYSLQKKHKLETCEALIELRNNIEIQLQAINNFEEQIAALEKDLQSFYEQVIKLAGNLTQSRKKAVEKLELELISKVCPLGMPNMKFTCELTSKSHPDSTGMDCVNFLFSSNKNVGLKPVSEIASGGEISRLMLGIKSLIAGAMALPTIIFDEIDTGVSGEIADKMGDIMYELGQQMQVITITHLPQIAAKGTTHYFVYKHDVENTTETNIRKLNPEERVKEIAQMLSGSELTNAAFEHARNLLKMKN
ncbi:MAG: DNA repair protein RecN [Dysgonamonadaceae bacterium]|jgi:DNA repair protein RecN (Recombination protein N)|nr:DNA repair protein RecN [Dysgonamonadaceae bacterium]